MYPLELVEELCGIVLGQEQMIDCCSNPMQSQRKLPQNKDYSNCTLFVATQPPSYVLVAILKLNYIA